MIPWRLHGLCIFYHKRLQSYCCSCHHGIACAAFHASPASGYPVTDSGTMKFRRRRDSVMEIPALKPEPHNTASSISLEFRIDHCTVHIRPAPITDEPHDMCKTRLEFTTGNRCHCPTTSRFSGQNSDPLDKRPVTIHSVWGSPSQTTPVPLEEMVLRMYGWR